MKRFWIAGFSVVAVSAAGVVAAALTRSPDYHVERSIDVEASPERVYDVLSDFREFVKWSPWEKLDPNMEKVFSGAERGLGAEYHWSGDRKVGEGHMTVVEAEPVRRVACKLEFLRPFSSVCTTTWSLDPHPSGCRVTWAMDGTNEGLPARVMGLLLPMDKMIGKDFEQGLRDLKELCED